jgi:D-alanyl-D-alanine carboxypeptidase
MTNHAEVQRILDDAVAREDVPGIVTQITDRDGTWFGAAGVADTETGRPRERGEQLRVASIGKAFTAAVVLALAAEGRLDIDDSVRTWLPEIFEGTGYDGSAITLRQLLNGTSGLHNTAVSDEIVRRMHTRAGLAQHRFDVWSRDELLGLAVSRPPVGEPGRLFAPTNGGYFLAAAVVERVTGRSYQDELERTVVQPLGLTGTYLPGPTETRLRGPHGRAYTRMFVDEAEAAGDPVDVTDINPSVVWAAGAHVSTTDDLTRFFTALITGSLLPAAQHEAMWTTVSTEGANWIPNTAYGLGVFECRLAGGTSVRGGVGQGLGTVALAMGTPDGHTLVTHSNGDWNAFPVFWRQLEAEFAPPAQPTGTQGARPR